MVRMLQISLSVASLLGGLMVSAQEPATIDSEPAVRFAQGNGYFHYAAFCRTPKEFSAQVPKSGLPLDKVEFGIGWYVEAAVSRSSSSGVSPALEGRIVVSLHHVRFIPRNAQFAAQYVDLPRDKVELAHAPGQPDGWLRSNETILNFHFSKICLSCAAGAPKPPGLNAALVDQEFALLGETINRFESGWRKTYRLSKGDTVDLASGNQPAPSRSAVQVKGREALNSSASPAVSFAPANTKPVAAIPSPVDRVSNSAPSSTQKAAGSSVPGIPKGKPVKIASGSAAGLIVKKVPPQYPLEAKLVRLEGTVVVRAVIDRSGVVSEVTALSGPPLLESAAVDAVKQWQYKPYAVNGQPVDVETTIEVIFALDRSQPASRTLAARRQGGGQ